MAHDRTEDEALQDIVSATEFADLREEDLLDDQQSFFFHYRDEKNIRESRWQDALVMYPAFGDGH